MRRQLLIIASIGLLITACSSKTKKAETETAAPAKMTKEDKKAVEDKSSSGEVKCSLKNDHRVLAVKKKGKGCELAYNKVGKEEVAASAVNGTSYCQKVMDKIKTNLTNSGYSCN